jgi:hypothetical protein
LRLYFAMMASIALVSSASPLCAQTSWLSTGIRAERDNQPRQIRLVNAEYGRYLSSSVTLSALMTALHVAGATTVEPGVVATLALPAARVGLTAGTSTALAAPGPAAALWTGRAGVNLGRDISLRFGHRRERYTATLASLDTSVLVQTAEARLDRASAPGWAGELVARRESFGDGNPIATAWGWALAPLSRSPAHSIRAGYSLAWQDAAYSNWVADETLHDRGPSADDVVPGHYVPYYTPHDVVVHSVLVGTAFAAGRSWILLDGSYGVHATELAPALHTAPGKASTQLLFYERSFSPYRLTAVWTTPLQTSASLTIELAHARTAYYRTTAIAVRLTRSPTR